MSSNEPLSPILAPSFSEVSKAYDEISQHNSKHTGFGMVFGALFGAIAEQTTVSSDAEDIYEGVHERMADKLEDRVLEGDMEGELQGILHSDLLLRAGIYVSPSGGRVEDGAGRAASSHRLVVSIGNGQLFADFLKHTLPEDVVDKGDHSMLVELAGGLSGRIRAGFADADKADPMQREAAEDALRTWDLASDEYARLGISSESVRQRLAEDPGNSGLKRQLHILGELEQSLDYWGSGLLPEFLVAWHEGYIQPEEEFYYWPPARWAEDMKPDELSGRWEAALDFIESLRGREEATGLRKVIQDNLRVSLDVSIDSMIQHERSVTEAYERKRAEWEAHGGQPYDDPQFASLGIKVSKAPDPNGVEYTYGKNNRIALETAKLRLDSEPSV